MAAEPPQKPPPNLYTRRLTPMYAQKPCYICHKPTPVVLITPCAQDFFYICAGHLLDRAFATPAPGEPGAPSPSTLSSSTTPEAEKKRKEQELADEVKAITATYNARLLARNAAKKARAKDTEKSNGKTIKDDTDPALSAPDPDLEGSDSADERERGSKIEAVKKKHDEVKEARVFVLHKDIYGMRVQRRKDAASVKRRGEGRKANPGAFAFPAVPRGM